MVGPPYSEVCEAPRGDWKELEEKYRLEYASRWFCLRHPHRNAWSGVVL